MRAQINMFETIAVLIVFMFLLGVGLVVYAQMHKSTLNKDVNKARDEKAVRIAETAFFLPELDCTFRGVRPPGACVELLKVYAMSELNQDEDRMVAYYEMFGDSRIEIIPVFPEGDKIMIYDRSVGNRKTIVSRSPVLLLDVVKGPTSYGFGIMEVATTYET